MCIANAATRGNSPVHCGSKGATQRSRSCSRCRCVAPLTPAAGQPVSRCYEARTTEPHCLPVATFSLATNLEPARQLEAHPSGLIPLGWAADARPPPPLTLPPSFNQSLQPPLQNGADMRIATAHSGGGLASGRTSPAGPRSWQPAGAPPPHWYGGSGIRGSHTYSHGAQGQLRSLNLPEQQGTFRAVRPVSGGGSGASPHAATASALGAGPGHGEFGDEVEPQPRPSPRGLRPYGSPGVSAGGAMEGAMHGRGGQQVGDEGWQQPTQHQQWGLGEGEEGDRTDGVCMGSPVHVERYDAASAKSTVQAGLALSCAPGSPPLPMLLGDPYAPSPRHSVSPRHTVHGISCSSPFLPGQSQDTLRDSLDTGRRAATAAAAAIASAEAAVMRSSGGGVHGWRRDADRSGNRSPGGDPLRWSLQQSAQAVGGLAVALDAAATALNRPPADGSPPRPSSLRGQHQPPQNITVATAGDGWGDIYTISRPATADALAAGPPSSVVAVAGWAGGDAAARELQEEVMRLRAEVSRVHRG